jgi:hypothetical protein
MGVGAGDFEEEVEGAAADSGGAKGLRRCAMDAECQQSQSSISRLNFRRFSLRFMIIVGGEVFLNLHYELLAKHTASTPAAAWSVLYPLPPLTLSILDSTESLFTSTCLLLGSTLNIQ